MDNNRFKKRREDLIKKYPEFYEETEAFENGKKYIYVKCRRKAGVKKIETNKFIDLSPYKSILPRVSDGFPFRLAAVGRSRSGKSFLVASYMFFVINKLKLYKPENVHVFSPTAKKLDQSYNCIDLDDENIYRVFSTGKLKALYDRYETEQLERDANGEPRENILVIFDDCVSSLGKRDNPLNGVFFNMRHANMDAILISQAYLVMPKAFRTNSSGTLLFGNVNNQDFADVLKETSIPAKIIKLAYNEVSKKKYSFLYFDNETKKLYIDFDTIVKYKDPYLD